MGLLVGIGFLVMIVAVLIVFSRTDLPGDRNAISQRDRVELDRLRTLVDDLKETAWEHRELDSSLSVIIIDKIRTHERRNRELGP